MNPTIFILGAAKFDSPIESTSLTMARHLAKHYRVYYIDYPFTWKDCLRFRNTPAYAVRKVAFGNPAKSIRSTDNPNLKIVIPPPVASINFLPEGNLYRFFLGLVERRITEQIKGIIKSENIENYIYINSYNFHYPGVANGLSPALTVYQCVDPLVVPYDRKHGITSEDKLVLSSDLVICTSKQLAAEKSRLNPNTHLIPNAADISHSQKALDPLLPVHPKISGIQGAIVGYFGAIERRMDFGLLQQVIEMNRDKSFVLAGPVDREAVPDWFFSAPNVYFTDRIPYDEMPAMIKGFDVAIIPFKKDQYSRTIFPLKLFEYLGAGKPVVATDFNPDLADYTGSAVYFAETSQRFSDFIKEALSDSPEKQQERVAVALMNTWEQRAACLEAILSEHLSKQASGISSNSLES